MSNRIFTFKYIPKNIKVYYIAKQTPLKSRHNACFYTEPFYSHETKKTRNAFYAFCDKAVAEYKLSYLNEDCEINEDNLYDIKYLSEILRVPLVVEISRHCDLYDIDTEYIEVFYHHKNLIPFTFSKHHC